MARATFAIVVEYETGPALNDRIFFPIGTGFRIASDVLATNAHVAEAILKPLLPVKQVHAVQASTGQVDNCRSVTIHPEYTGDPLQSPDVAIVKTVRSFQDILDLADESILDGIALGDRLLLSGFPGDVNEIYEIVPGQTVPQATTLSGAISALRSFDSDVIVNPSNVDIIQHDLPTSPGTSGSPLAICGKVIGINNAGTFTPVLSLDEHGLPIITRVPQASNNFGVHVKYLRELLSFGSRAESQPLPPPPPNYQGKYSCEAYALNLSVLHHQFVIDIDSQKRAEGTSCFLEGGFHLVGDVDRYGNLTATDDAATYGYAAGEYVGFADASTGTIAGSYSEEGQLTASWECVLDNSAEAPCEEGVLPIELTVSLDGCPSGPADLGATITLVASVPQLPPSFDVWFEWEGANPRVPGGHAATLAPNAPIEVVVTAHVYRDADGDGRAAPNEELQTVEGSCFIDTAPLIDGVWDVSWYYNGSLYGMCLAIRNEELVAVYDGCDEPNLLISARPLSMTDTTIRIEFFWGNPDVRVYHDRIQGTAVTSDFYDVVLSIEGPGGTIGNIDSQMERATR